MSACLPSARSSRSFVLGATSRLARAVALLLLTTAAACAAEVGAPAPPACARPAVELTGARRGRVEARFSWFAIGELGCFPPRDPAAGAAAYAAQVLSEIGATGRESLAITSLRTDELGRVHVRLEERVGEVPILGAGLVVHADAASGQVYALHGRLAAAGGATAPGLSGWEAVADVIARNGIAAAQFLDDPGLVYVLDERGGARLAWSARAYYLDGGEQVNRFFADAWSGAPIGRDPELRRVRFRRVYSAPSFPALPGRLVLIEGGNAADPAAMAAYAHLGITYDYFRDRFDRDAWDDRGAPAEVSVHYTAAAGDAFWSGGQIVLGDSGGAGSLAGALDVVAHEYGHAVVAASAGLPGRGEGGALDEGLADLFAAGTEAWADGGESVDTWRIGEDLGAGGPLRSLADPAAFGGCDYHPDCPLADPHDGAGVVGLAFQLLASGGQHPRGRTHVAVPGVGLAAAEQIAYRALTVYMTPATDLASARHAFWQAALDLDGPEAAAAVDAAWDAVGVGY